ncbi:MAG: N-6 DNA methylase [Candidatus Altiarchaeota archaeon]
MAAPEKIVELVERFEWNKKSYLSAAYNETQLREEFINPFFEELGWDVRNVKGIAEAYKDVIHEDAIRIGQNIKAPDYSFRIGGTRKFFLETKKPSVNIKGDVSPAYQIRRYSWSAKLPLAVLTDFEEFAVYDCRKKPLPNDSASVGRILYVRYDEYATRWDEIANIFAKTSIEHGLFDQYAESVKGKKGTSEVDDEFLKEIERWRDELAKNIALRNPKYSVREINYAVQKTIDRIIFLRICEDRGIEPYEQLQEISEKEDIYTHLLRLFEKADEKYNSGIFYFKEEKGRTSFPDYVCPNLKIDDKVFRDMIKNLYYPNCPYEFSVIGADILGNVYEQFLGKVIRLTEGHRAKVEEKPEVKKAGGVYYTPKYIVDYIVQNTVGRLIEGKSPKQVEKLKVLDPACGSGSFLIGAYQKLLDYHRDWYVSHDPGKNKDAVYQGKGGQWYLTLGEKKRILLNNIYGVDIDEQAVEVAKLNLLLKVLEDEHREPQKRLGGRVLPDLDNNIKCGNSLIGPDFYTGQTKIFTEEETLRINTFNWKKEFPFKFDAVIGNPPYLNIDDTWGKKDPRLKAIKKGYPEIYNDKTDILFYFIGKALQLSQDYISFIVSRAFLEAYKADKLRGYILENSRISEIIDFQNYPIFPRVGITTCIINLQSSSKNGKIDVYKLLGDELLTSNLSRQIQNFSIFQKIRIGQSNLTSEPWSFVSEDNALLNEKIDNEGEKLGQILIIGQGMQTGRNNVFGKITSDKIISWGVKKGNYYNRASNSDIQRFFIKDRGDYLLYLEDVIKFDNLPNAVQKHLLENSSELKARAAYKRGDCEWWKYTWPLHKEHYDRKKIMCPYLAKYNRFAIDYANEFIGLTDTTVLFENNQPEDLLYLLGLLNSKLLTYRFKSIGKLKSGGIYEYFWNSISKISIRRIDFSNPLEKKQHDDVVSLVSRMLGLHNHLAGVKTPQERSVLERQIEATDNEINSLVYKLYGLTEDEIKIVEDGTG